MLSRLPPLLSPRRPVLPLPLFALAALALPGAAHAELKVRLSQSVTGVYEPVRITVNDPLGGLDASPGPITITIADGRDHRREMLLDPTSQAGEWSGYFTPKAPGRYTGSAVLARGDEKEVGLVPLLRVRASKQPGFLRMGRVSRRSFEYPNGDNLFPIGVRLAPEDLTTPHDWVGELSRLRAGGVNYLEVPVAWPGDATEAQSLEAARQVDALVEAASRAGRPVLQLRLEGPAQLTEESLTAYSTQLVRWTRRWSYSPAVAVWHLAGIPVNASPDQCNQLVRAVRLSDAYNHLIAIPGKPDQLRGGADLVVAPLDPTHVANLPAILETSPPATQTALPGETDWQLLAVGGVGLPLPLYRPGSPESLPLLNRLRSLSTVASTVPYQVAATQLTDVVPLDVPGSFCRYGGVTVGWVAPDALQSVRFRSLPSGRYRVRFWSPATGDLNSETQTESDGREAVVMLPPRQEALFMIATRVGASTGAKIVAVAPRATQQPLTPPMATAIAPIERPKPIIPPPAPPMPVVPPPVAPEPEPEPEPPADPDPAELAAQREADRREAAQEAARRAARARARRAAQARIRAERNARRRAILQARYDAQEKWEEHLARKRAREKRVAIWMKRRAVLQARYDAQEEWEAHLSRKRKKERAAAKSRKANAAPAKKAKKKKRGR